jgi:hypothetical protein
MPNDAQVIPKDICDIHPTLSWTQQQDQAKMKTLINTQYIDPVGMFTSP